jgi:hypothetical protein
MQETLGTGTTEDAAVSEVTGVILLTGVVIIMLSTLGVYVFAMESPDDVPHTRLQAWTNNSENKIYLKQTGGEFLITKDCEILLNSNGKKYDYSSEKIFRGLGNESVWGLGEVLTIDTDSEWGLNIKSDDEIELFLVDSPSKQPIQVFKLTKEDQVRPSLKIWITPKGNITDTSGGYGELRQVQKNDSVTPEDVLSNMNDKDRPCTVYHPSLNHLNSSEYQEFEFDINPLEYGVDPDYTFSNVTLKIIYHSHDVATKQIKMEIYTESRGWEYLAEDLPPQTSTFTAEDYNLTDYIHNAEELMSFRIRIEAWATNDQKNIYIDYMALWIE